MNLKESLINLLKETSMPGAVTEEALSNIAMGLAQTISDLENAIHNGDVTIKTLERCIHKQNDDDADKAIKAAKALQETPYAEECKDQLAAVESKASALKAVMQATRSSTKGKLPKAARMYLCVEIIVAWKLIKNTDEIPGRTSNRNQDRTAQFLDFLEALLETAGGHVGQVSVDELHRSILATAKEMARIEEAQKNPKVISFLEVPRPV